MGFMQVKRFDAFGRITVTRSGYTGEDGYEILVRAEQASALAEKLLAHPEVKPIGLGARDSLRLEAGLCLYGHDLDPTTSPIEADLAWTIQKRRREAGDFPGAARIKRELDLGPSRKRVGIRPNDRAPAREGVEVMRDGKQIGIITSGGFSPVLNGPISMGYVEAEFAAPGTGVDLLIRGQSRPATTTPLPFVPHRISPSPPPPERGSSQEFVCMTTRLSPKITNGCGWRAMSPSSASALTPPSNWAMLFTPSFRQ